MIRPGPDDIAKNQSRFSSTSSYRTPRSPAPRKTIKPAHIEIKKIISPAPRAVAAVPSERSKSSLVRGKRSSGHVLPSQQLVDFINVSPFIGPALNVSSSVRSRARRGLVDDTFATGAPIKLL